MIYKLKCRNNDEKDFIEFEQYNSMTHEIGVSIFNEDSFCEITLNKNDISQLIDSLKVIHKQMTD